jgi:hypothetical protein
MSAFDPIADPHVPIRLPSGTVRADPREALSRLADAKTPAERRAVLASAFSLPEGFTLTAYQCSRIFCALIAYVDHADEVYRASERAAELLYLYKGAITLDNLRSMSDVEKLAFLSHGFRMRCRDRLDFGQDVLAVFDKDSPLRAELVEIVYAGDPKTRDKNLEVLSRV